MHSRLVLQPEMTDFKCPQGHTVGGLTSYYILFFYVYSADDMILIPDHTGYDQEYFETDLLYIQTVAQEH